MEKKEFNYFKLRYKTPFYNIVIFITIAVFLKLGSEMYFETLELRDLLPLFFVEIVFFIAFLFEYNKKVIVSDEGIRVKRVWAQETFMAWEDVKSIGTYKHDIWGKIQPSPEKEGLRNAMFISKSPFEKLSYTFINRRSQTLTLPFDTELYTLIKHKLA